MREKFERFEKYMEYSGLNDNQVTAQCSLAQGLINQARKGKSDLGPKTIDKILTTYQDINKVWLLTGEGEMLKSSVTLESEESEKTGYRVPLLPILAQAGHLNDFSIGIRLEDCEKIISPIKGADFAIKIDGDSMFPEYPSGSIVLIKKVNEKIFLEWGKVYVLDTCNGTLVKKIMPTENKEVIRCISINSDYPPFEVETQHIIGFYRVLMSMCMK